MGKKRYFCDYCDKHFADNPQTRKKHNLGVQHSIAKRIHFDKFKGAEELLKDDETKEACRRFLATGECQYGSTCRHSHITPDVRQQLLEQVRRDKGIADGDSELLPELRLWLQKNAVINNTETESSLPALDRKIDPGEELPESLRAVHDLPPSLLPPSLRCNKGFTKPPLEWG
ncbi:zinc finger matrin-type protein 5-like [Watersipora subatra]|uniref:zinc finger matrin-type protein 5-like n=1 Tax=Watersipora subatra TaxID=2589382 RepID=UPI00355C1B18